MESITIFKSDKTHKLKIEGNDILEITVSKDSRYRLGPLSGPFLRIPIRLCGPVRAADRGRIPYG